MSDSLMERVNHVIAEDIRGSILSHGGDIRVREVKDGVVTIVLEGSCRSCPSAQVTTEELVKERLLEKLGEEIVDVHLFTELSDEMWSFAKTFFTKKRTL